MDPFFTITLDLDLEITTNKRRIYSINDLLVDVGGLSRSVVTIFEVLFTPLSTFLFYLKSIKRLFFA